MCSDLQLEVESIALLFPLNWVTCLLVVELFLGSTFYNKQGTSLHEIGLNWLIVSCMSARSFVTLMIPKNGSLVKNQSILPE